MDVAGKSEKSQGKERSSQNKHLPRRGKGRPFKLQQREPTLTQINPDTKFLDDKQIDGVELLTDIDQVREIQVRLAEYDEKASSNHFPVMWPIKMSKVNIRLLSTEPYVVTPKATGPRFLLYVDSCGQVFMENMTQHIFQVKKDVVPKMISLDSQLIFDTILDGILTRVKSTCSTDETAGRLTFFIQDGIRCNGKDLTRFGVLQRIAFVKELIMKPRLAAMESGTISNELEVFDLDIVQGFEASLTNNYLSDEFESNFKYPLSCLVFFPRQQAYKYGSCHTVLNWKENDDLVCSFRLRIPSPKDTKGSKEPLIAELLVMGTESKLFKPEETPYATINVTDEIREMDGRIADFRYVNQQWVFSALRYDRQHPNGKNTLKGKLDAFNNPVTRTILLDYVTKSDATLLDGKQLDGIHLLHQFDLVSQMQVLLDLYVPGPTAFFSAMQYGVLSLRNVHLLFSTKSPSYVMAPKPTGPRYLLYVDSSGQIFLENMSQHVFRVDEDRAVQMITSDTVLDGTLTRAKLVHSLKGHGSEEKGGKLTFVIQDAIRCSGVDLSESNVVERIAFVNDAIMKPRLDALEKMTISEDREAFNLDIVEYKETSQAKDYLCDNFENGFSYQLDTFVFLPQFKGYKFGYRNDVVQWSEKSSGECLARLRLKIPKLRGLDEGELYVVGPDATEVSFATIALTDDIRQLNDSIIECSYDGNQWTFVRLRNDRLDPTGQSTLEKRLNLLRKRLTRILLLQSLENSTTS